MRFQDAMDLREGWLEPGVIVIVDDAAARAILVPDEVRRIGEHEIDAARGQVRHEIYAVAAGGPVKHLIEEAVHLRLPQD